MHLLLIILGIMMVMGSTYGWQQEVFTALGDFGSDHALSCLLSAGLHNCPTPANLVVDNLFATGIFYLGICLLLYVTLFPGPSEPPTEYHS